MVYVILLNNNSSKILYIWQADLQSRRQRSQEQKMSGSFCCWSSIESTTTAESAPGWAMNLEFYLGLQLVAGPGTWLHLHHCPIWLESEVELQALEQVPTCDAGILSFCLTHGATVPAHSSCAFPDLGFCLLSPFWGLTSAPRIYTRGSRQRGWKSVPQ